MDYSQMASSQVAGDSADRVQRSIAYMREHLNEPLQVATLAALANVSASHFFALFKRQTGCPPIDYFTRLRMQQASRIMDTTKASVKEVAAALGYDDPFYFSRVFKAVHRVPPSYYRMSRGNSMAEPNPIFQTGSQQVQNNQCSKLNKAVH